MELFRFGIVGLIAFGIHYGIYSLLLWLWKGINVSLAYTIGYVISFFCNMWLSSRFTFREGLSVKRGVGFALSHVCNYFLHLGFLNLFLWLGMSEQLSPIPTLCIVVPINFVLVRTVFKKIRI